MTSPARRALTAVAWGEEVHVPTGLSLRAAPFLAALTDLGDLHVVGITPWARPAEGRDPSQLYPLGINAKSYHLLGSRSRPLRAPEVLRWAFGRVGPRTLLKWQPAEVATELTALSLPEPDLVLSVTPYAAAVSEIVFSRSVPHLVDLVDFDPPRDLQPVRLRPVRGLKKSVRLAVAAFASELDIVFARRHVAHTTRSACAVFISTEQDKQRLGLPSVQVVPNTYPEPPKDRRLGPAPTAGQVIGYVGTMHYAPNVDAAERLVSDVLPLVCSEIADTQALIVGRGASKLSHLQGECVQVISDPDDIAEQIRRVAVMALPISVGSGSRVKILEAFAYGVPVVSTRVGAEGLDVEDGMHLLLADSAEAMAAAVVRVLRDDALRRALVTNAQQLYRSKYHPEAVRAHVRGIASGCLAGITSNS